MKYINRRNFLKASSLTSIPLIAPIPLIASSSSGTAISEEDKRVLFYFDGPGFRPSEYIARLQSIDQTSPIQQDTYGNGGAVATLEKKFAAITGKEAAIFMPSGTMANQLAIAVLSGQNSKVFVQETSHVYRDEADAAQTVFGKRLIPLAKGEACFTLEELKQSVDYHNKGEVFKSGIGAISIENPVRRSDGRYVPIEEIKKISSWCREKGYKLHLDGARIFMAAAWSGTSVEEYSRYFDTVYISLYKYFGAAGGAVLCGDKKIIDQMTHLIKIHGGTMYQNWTNAAMALRILDGFEERLLKAIQQSKELFALLNQLPELKVKPLANGTNIYDVDLLDSVDSNKLSTNLREKHNIFLPTRSSDGIIKLTVNETLLRMDTNKILNAFKESIQKAI